MSHLHRGRFIRLRHEKNAGGDGAAVLNREPVAGAAPAAPAAPKRKRAKAKKRAKR